MPRCVTCGHWYVLVPPWALWFRIAGSGQLTVAHRACTRVRPAVERVRRLGWVARRQAAHAAWVRAMYGPGGSEWEESRLERQLGLPSHVREPQGD